MDFKGIDWAGNIHMKYEFMYSEVEETTHEDTMKYLENQVQKVGASVKKFYEEVLDDLIPSSCIRPRRASIKKPKSTISDMHEELKSKADRGEDICDLTAEDSILSAGREAKHLSTMPPRVLVGNTLSDACSIKSKAAGVSRRSIGIIRICHSPKMTPAMSSLSGDRLVHGVKSNSIVASDDLNVTRSSVRHDPGEAVTGRISDASIESCNSHQILSTDIVASDDLNVTRSSVRHDPGQAVTKRISDASVESCDSNQILSPNSVKPEKNPAPEKDSSAESPRQNNGAPIGDSFDIEVIETKDVVEAVQKSKMELHLVSQTTKKHKSFKKKIYDVLSLKFRSARKQDPCVSDHEDSAEKKACENGWELL